MVKNLRFITADEMRGDCLAANHWERVNRFADPALRDNREHLIARLLNWRLRTALDRTHPTQIGA